MPKNKNGKIDGILVLIIILLTIVVLFALTLLAIIYIYPVSYYQLIVKAVDIKRAQIMTLTEILAPIAIGLLIFFVCFLVKHSNEKKDLHDNLEKTEVEKLLDKQYNPTDKKLFSIQNEEPIPLTKRERIKLIREEEARKERKLVEREMAEVGQEKLEKPSPIDLSNFSEIKTKSPEVEEINDEIGVDLVSKVKDLEIEKPSNSSFNVDDLINKIIDNFSEDMNMLPIVEDEDNKDFELDEVDLDNNNSSEDTNTIENHQPESLKEVPVEEIPEVLIGDFDNYPSLILKAVEDNNIDTVETEITAEDLEIIGNDSNPKGIYYKKDLVNKYFSFEDFSKEEIASANRLNYDITFFTANVDVETSDKILKSFEQGCSCYLLKNKTLFIAPFYNAEEVKAVMKDFTCSCNFIDKKDNFDEVKEILAI